MKCLPEKADFAAFVDLACINSLSNGSYSTWVSAEAAAKRDWASLMLKSAGIVDAYLKFWIEYMDMASNRKSGGLSVLCQIIPVALPISKKHIVHAVRDCAVTGQKGRPCFEVVSMRASHQNIHVHHALLDSCQTLWAVQNHILVLRNMMQQFSVATSETQLDKICTEFESCSQRAAMIDYLVFICGDVRTIFSMDNCFVNTESFPST